MNENDMNEEDINILSEVKENTPKVKQVSDEERQKFLDSIAKMDFGDVVEVKKVCGEEVCPHCNNTVKFTINEGNHTTTCPHCGKEVLLCSLCDNNNECDNCIYCDLVNFKNYINGKNTISEFLSALNPPLTDMTTGLNNELEATYQNYINDVDNTVEWDVKYWGIYGMIETSHFNKNNTEQEIIDFLKVIIKKNKE